jgi:Asp-tRNA(Asn)/Glu-tRNA(Gln) amidotransferase A subunit family amidase
MTEITAKSLVSLTELIRSREASPVEVMQAYLDRIAELNPKLNAIVTVAPDVVEKARKAEAAISRGEMVGPLHGIPITVKDTIETKGLRTTSGSALRADFVPDRDADAVGRLKAAGAIILGKTNTAEMAMDYTTDNPVFGRAVNPNYPLLSTGGSSGGEAAAIASFMSPGGIGSDLAGSIRIPAHFCGIVGLKPSVGRVPGDGQFPPSIGPYSLGAAIGPLARSVSDLRLLFDVLAGNGRAGHRGDTDGVSELRYSLRGRRVAWYTDDLVSPVTKETEDAVEAAARTLARAGLSVVQERPTGVEQGHDLWLKLFSRASVALLRGEYAGQEEKAGEFIRWRLASADNTPTTSLDEYIASWLERDRVREKLVRWMEDVPLIIAPVGATAALPHDAHKVLVRGQTVSVFRAFSYAQTFNVFDLPVAVIPVGTSAEGLPIGVQIIGRPFEEETVLAAAAVIEEAMSDTL